MTATAYIVDDDAGFRESLVWLINSADIHCEEYDSAESFLAGYKGGYGCLLLDIRMGGMSGLDLQKQLTDQGVKLPVIILTGHGDVPLTVTAMKNGAVDFIEKPFDGEQLIEKVEIAIKDSKSAFLNGQKRNKINDLFAELSAREQDVCQLMLSGLKNKEMAESLGISVRTLEIHRLRVLKKMKVKNVVELSLQLGPKTKQ